MSIQILLDKVIDIDLVNDPEELPHIDIIIRTEKNFKSERRIEGWASIHKEGVDQIISILTELGKKL